MDLHVLAQGAGMRVGLVAAADLAVVRLVAGVDVGVLLSVAAVGELPVAAVEFAFKGLLPCRQTASCWLKPGPAFPPTWRQLRTVIYTQPPRDAVETKNENQNQKKHKIQPLTSRQASSSFARGKPFIRTLTTEPTQCTAA